MDHLPRKIQQQILEKNLKFYVIDGYSVARQTGMGSRINTIMQTCFFAISGVLPREEAIAAIKKRFRRPTANAAMPWFRKISPPSMRRSPLARSTVPSAVSSHSDILPPVPEMRRYSCATFSARSFAGNGDSLPVSALPPDGTFPTGTAKWEKRNIAQQIPVWEEDLCIQCGKCVLVCPHAVIRAKVYEAAPCCRSALALQIRAAALARI